MAISSTRDHPGYRTASAGLLFFVLISQSMALDIELKVEFGPDRGQNFGILFALEDRDGRTRCGAGFVSVYNTLYRHDRLTLQFFLRPGSKSAPETFDVEPLPRPSRDGGSYAFDFDGRLFIRSTLYDSAMRRWKPPSGSGIGTWEVDDSYDPAQKERGELFVGVWP